MQVNIIKPDTSNGLFSNGDPTKGTPGTIVKAEFLNSILTSVESMGDELLEVLKTASIDPRSDKKNLIDALNQLFAKIESPKFRGEPQSTTPNLDDKSTRIATTSYVVDLLEEYFNSIQIPEAGITSRYIPGQIISVSSALNATVLQANRLLFCNGALVSRSLYKDLFAAIGTRYGAGDGSTTFQIPSFLIGDTLVFSETGSRTSGSVISHSHSASGSTSSGGSHNHTMPYAAAGASGSSTATLGGSGGYQSSSAAAHSHTVSVSVSSAGGSYNLAAGVYTSFYIAY